MVRGSQRGEEEATGTGGGWPHDDTGQRGVGTKMARNKASMTVDVGRVREVIESEAARALGPAGVMLAQDVWEQRRPRELAGLNAVLREIGEHMDDPEQVERYVQRVMQRLLGIARGQ